MDGTATISLDTLDELREKGLLVESRGAQVARSSQAS